MKKHFSIILFALTFACTLSANNNQDALAGIDLNEIVITGSRDQSPVSEIPSTVSVIDSEDIESRFEPSLLTILNEQIPGFFSTSRSVMGYGISTGAAGGINIRGIGGTNSAQMLVLIDGHPQYAGLMGHPIADLSRHYNHNVNPFVTPFVHSRKKNTQRYFVISSKILSSTLVK